MSAATRKHGPNSSWKSAILTSSQTSSSTNTETTSFNEPSRSRRAQTTRFSRRQSMRLCQKSRTSEFGQNGKKSYLITSLIRDRQFMRLRAHLTRTGTLTSMTASGTSSRKRVGLMAASNLEALAVYKRSSRQISQTTTTREIYSW